MAAVFAKKAELSKLAVLYDADLTATPPSTDADKKAAVDLLERLGRKDLAAAQKTALGI